MPQRHRFRPLARLLPALLLVLSAAACMGGGDPLARRGPRPDATLAPGATLLIPVRGVRPEQLRDSYHAPRSGGRTHNAIDIPARRGTPVLAAADGRILKLRRSDLGGVTLYQLDDDGRTVYYYAHLQRYVAGLREGQEVWRGQIIAYVGDTGNAGRGNYHLHFSVGTLRDARRWWESENTNPFPLLAGDAARPREGGGRAGGSDGAGPPAPR